MCGIFAMFLNRPLTPNDLTRGRRATRMLAHRGPDGEGEWYDEAAGVFLGHRRLSIIDLSTASDQPFRRNGRALTYNGEIYNYRDLQRDLRGRGVEITTEGDTEVLLQAWATFGPAALDRVDGMFAFALWDGETAALAVDPFGEKPLYVAESAEGVYVASELQPLVDLLQPQPDLAGDRLTAFLALGYLPSPQTAWRGIRRLPAGHHATVTTGRLGPVRSYWQPQLPKVPRGPVRELDDRDLDRFRDALAASLERRYVADVPLCLFLSAGVDSSLLAALSVHELGRRPPCVTVGFPDSSVPDEAPAAQEIAAQLGLTHRSLHSQAAAASEDRVLELLGQPGDNVTVLSIRQMCAAVGADFKLGLTGMGGDEVFFGYGKHHHLYRRRHWRTLPSALRGLLQQAAARLSRARGGSGRHLDALLADDHEIYLALKNTGAIAWLRQQPGFDVWARDSFDWRDGPAYLKAAWYEIAENMQCSQLPAIDHGSMRASMELRTPFLSRELLDLVAEYDPRAFMAMEQKAVLRRLLKRYLPERLVDRPKAGFRFPPDRLVTERQPPEGGLLGLPPTRVAEAWGHRLDGPNWTRLCLRLALAETFLAQRGGTSAAPQRATA
jgi:asparagine synthase (glutamine-hydrolysing)